jgi:molybdopterin converting factor small subunit
LAAPINVTVRFAGPLRTLAGRSSLNLTFEEGATLRDLLSTLHGTVSPSFVAEVVAPLEAGTAPVTPLLFNRVHLPDHSGLDRLLAEGDVIAFVPPMAGG